VNNYRDQRHNNDRYHYGNFATASGRSGKNKKAAVRLKFEKGIMFQHFAEIEGPFGRVIGLALVEEL
jgi:hypothetical protein